MKILKEELSAHFIDNFVKRLDLTDQQLDNVLSKLERKYLPSKSLLVSPGMVSNYKAFIAKGAVRTYKLDAEGKEITLFFSFESCWISDYFSFLKGTPSTQFIQTMEDCEMYILPKDSCMELYYEIPSFKRFYDEKYEMLTIQTMDRLCEVKSQSPEERYTVLIEKYPFVFQRAPLQYIASYLGVEPESLSRLRKRIFLKQASKLSAS